MEQMFVDIPEAEYERLNSVYPHTGKSSNVGKRAEEIIRIYFKSIDENYTFDSATKGADLKIILNESSFEIEVKGTSKNNLAWNQLKVSGKPSYERLQKGLPMYRVVSVYEKIPTLYILKYNEDFTMVPEARWAVKEIIT